MNGSVEAANKNIKKILQKMVDNHMQWHEKFSFALLGYRAIMRTSIGATPYMLEQLMLINEKRMDAVCHGQLYESRIASAFKKKVKPQKFTPGQLDLKKLSHHQEEAKGKFAPNWQGPYVVYRILSGGALILAEMEGRISIKPINSDAIKKYRI
ncbi:uncharacterized protein [Nicotiana tomentosiformis]|uniref:uncharacterized protein n=1 Tax=Nicotiana tomentosiformis TaxID=4098 RepID=UPI00051C5FF9|nr:uncharacterized protein LOC104108280 [Nicotiana tomentosiformis]